MHTKKEFMRLSTDFKECRDVLAALGDENRLHILYQMMITADPMGMLFLMWVAERELFYRL